LHEQGSRPIGAATRVPTTRHLEGGEALETLRSTGWKRLATDSFARFQAADGFSHARSLAYQLTLTALPALIAAVGLVTKLEQDDFRSVFKRMLLDLAPGSSSQTLTQAFRQGSQAADGSGVAIYFGLAATVIAATAAMGQIERGANRIYGIDVDRPALRKYTRGLLLALTSGLMTLAAFVAFLAGSLGEAQSSSGPSDTAVAVWAVARWPVGMAFVIVAFALLFRYSPKRDQPDASWLAVGSAVSVVLWLGFTGLLALYMSVSRAFGTYGPLAGTIGMLTWALLSSVAVFLGLAFAAQLEAVRAGSPRPTAPAPAGESNRP
jgi:YihY family inner membrane protein